MSILCLKRWTSWKSRKPMDFPGGLVVKTPHSQPRGYGFDPWLGKIPRATWREQKNF